MKARYLKAIVSVAFFVLLFKLVRAHDFLDMLRRIDPRFFWLSIAMSPVMIMTSCLKWKALLDLQGTPIRFIHLMRIYFIGYYFSNLLPSNVGGDVARSYYAGRLIGSQSHAAVSVFIERFTGLILLLVMVLVLPLFDRNLYTHAAILVPAAGALGLLILFLWILRYTRPLSALFAFMLGLALVFQKFADRARSAFLQKMSGGVAARVERLRLKADTFHDKLTTAIACLRKQPLTFLWVIVLTFAFYALAWLNVSLAFMAFGVEVPFWRIAVVLPTAMTVAMVPITLGSLGIAEGSYVFYFGLMGVAPAATLVMGLFLRFKMILSGLAGLILYLTHQAEKIENVEAIRNSGS